MEKFILSLMSSSQRLQNVKSQLAICLQRARAAEKEIPFFDTFYRHNDRNACSVALDARNRDKNYFPSIALPYDHNLVGSFDGYINASPMHFAGDAYIACQGPRRDTFAAFWQMVWHEACPMIVALTNFCEYYGGQEVLKFERYWPQEGQEEQYGGIQVAGTSLCLLKEWPGREERLVERRFIVRHREQERELVHLHMENWPDDSVIHPDSLLWLQDEVERRNLAGPTVVHCAGGIGRTGTFIAVHSLCRELRQAVCERLSPTEIDVAQRVAAMRSQRFGTMIARESQYRLLIDALELALPLIQP